MVIIMKVNKPKLNQPKRNELIERVNLCTYWNFQDLDKVNPSCYRKIPFRLD